MSESSNIFEFMTAFYGDEAITIDVFSEELSIIPDNATFVHVSEPNTQYTKADVESFVKEISSIYISVPVFEELMRHATVEEIANNGLTSYNSAKEFVKYELLEVITENNDFPVMRELLEQNINYENLAQEIVKTAGDGVMYFTDGKIFVRRDY